MSKHWWWTPAAGLLAACSQGTAADREPKDNSQLQMRVDTLERQVASLQGSRDILDREVAALQGNLGTDPNRKVATLLPSDKGYSTLGTDAGPMPVSLQSVEPYADGSRVHLRMANLTSATIVELRTNVRWGSVDAKSEFVGEPRTATWRKLDGPFPPGHWHDLTLDLPGVPPSKLGKVELSYGTVNDVTLPTG